MRTQEKHATRFRSIQTSLLFVIVPAVIISMAVLSLIGIPELQGHHPNQRGQRNVPVPFGSHGFHRNVAVQ